MQGEALRDLAAPRVTDHVDSVHVEHVEQRSHVVAQRLKRSRDRS